MLFDVTGDGALEVGDGLEDTAADIDLFEED